MRVTILVERLWFALEDETREPSHWTAQPIILRREHFSASSTSALWIRLPKRRWIPSLRAGFEYARSRPYDIRVTNRSAAIPLREFGDSPELSDNSRERPFTVWCQVRKQPAECIIATLPAQPRFDYSKVATELAKRLTQLRNRPVGPHRTLIKEIRKGYPGRRQASKPKGQAFVKRSLCLLNLFGESPELPTACYSGSARADFPEVFAELYHRLQRLEAGTSRTKRA